MKLNSNLKNETFITLIHLKNVPIIWLFLFKFKFPSNSQIPKSWLDLVPFKLFLLFRTGYLPPILYNNNISLSIFNLFYYFKYTKSISSPSNFPPPIWYIYELSLNKFLLKTGIGKFNNFWKPGKKFILLKKINNISQISLIYLKILN